MQPLAPDCIRLLHIEGGEDPAPIRCKLSQVSMKSPPAYEALSYVWGDPEEKCMITCNSEQVPVTRNLYVALPFLRLRDSERVMWIDAVCINQNDEQEQSQQLRIMGQIYKQASQVVVWLGEESQADQIAFAMLEGFKKSIEMNNKFQYNFIENEMEGILPPVGSKAWTALVNLFQRPWFFRVWVIQEVVVATKVSVACGSQIVSWDAIVHVALACQKTGYLGAHTIEGNAAGTHSASVIHSLKNPKQEVELMELLRVTRSYRATLAKDKVFALLGIASNSWDFGFLHYSLTAAEVFHSVAVHSLSQKKSLVCLSSAGISNTEPKHTLPTWVPDWEHTNDDRSVLGVGSRFSAAGSTITSLKISEDKMTLVIRGFVIDTISHVKTELYKVELEKPDANPASLARQEQDLLTAKQNLEKCDKFIAQAFKPGANVATLATRAWQYFTELVVQSPAATGQNGDEALWRTMCCDLSPFGGRAPEKYRGAFKFWRMMFKVSNSRGKINWSWVNETLWKEHHADGTELGHAVRSFSIGRDLCVTEGRCLGHVPHGSKVGDRICIFKGGSVPFVVRENANGYYQLIGECYIHGIMDGEAMEREDLKNLEQDFRIR